MKKKVSQKKQTVYIEDEEQSKVEEPVTLYTRSVKVIPSINDFTYSDFKQFAEKTPFTHAEWAAMLHVSERTLQRYAKNNGSFAPINAERFVQINHVLNRGKKVFGSVNHFYDWIHANPPMLEGNLSFISLTSFDGIQQIMMQLGRIEHGILS